MQPFVAGSRPSVDLQARGVKSRISSADGDAMPLTVPPRRILAAVAAPLLLAIAVLGTPTASYAASPPCAATTVRGLLTPPRTAHPPAHAPPATVETAVRCLVNAQRAAHRLAPLRPSRQLRVAAEAHGADMVAHRFFAHVSPFSGAVTDRVRRVGYLAHTQDWSLGEDIAWGEGSLSTPQSIVTAWMNSPGHRAVILHRDFRDVGLGVTAGVPIADGSMPGATFVLDAGAR